MEMTDLKAAIDDYTEAAENGILGLMDRLDQMESKVVVNDENPILSMRKTLMTAQAQLNDIRDDRDRLGRIAEIIETVDHRAMFGAIVTPTLQEMTQAEMSKIYALAKGKDEDWLPVDNNSRQGGKADG